MSIALFSLFLLVAVIALAFFFKMNAGLLSIAFAMIFGSFIGMSSKDIVAGFGYKLFMTLLGVMFLFSMCQQNGTLELLAKKTVALAGKQTRLIPIIVFLLAAVMAGIGCGTVPVMSLMAVFTIALAIQMESDPILLLSCGLLGSQAGGLTPLASTGILGMQLASAEGVDNIQPTFMGGQFISSFIFMLILYVILKGYKIHSDNPYNLKELPKLNREQWLSIGAILAVVVAVLIFKLDVGLCSFVAGVALILLKTAKEKEAISHIPWSTLILITGVGVLMNVVMKAGGIDLLASSLASIMNDHTVVPFMGLTGGIMSWFSSTSGVVMPTLIPTVKTTLDAMHSTVSPAIVITALTVTAHTAGCSPVSTGGALGLSSYVGQAQCTPEMERKLFIKLFAVAILGVIWNTFFAAIGGFGWIPLA